MFCLKVMQELISIRRASGATSLRSSFHFLSLNTNKQLNIHKKCLRQDRVVSSLLLVNLMLLLLKDRLHLRDEWDLIPLQGQWHL